MRKILGLLLIFLLHDLLVAQTNPVRPLVFTNVTVIDMTGAPMKSNMTVTVAGNHIASVGRIGKVRIPKNAQIIDANGKFLIPGLWDMHVHTLYEGRPELFFPMFISNGVTGARELASTMPFEQINTIRQKIERGEILAPRFGGVTGKILEGPTKTLGPEFKSVANVDEARKLVRERKAMGADFIKVYNLLSRDVYFAIADEAQKQKLPFVGHVPREIKVREASESGQKSIEHLTGMFIACSSKEDYFQAIPRGKMTVALANEMLDSFSEEKCRELSAVFVRDGTWHCPTLVMERRFAFYDDENFVNDVRLKYIPPAVRQSWKTLLARMSLPFGKKSFAKHLELVKLMRQSGVMFLAGSDAGLGNAYTFAGFSLHDELELFVKAGLSPLEALQTATINPAKFLGREKELGTIEKSKLADLVLLDANPLENISNTKKINAVVVNGRFFGRKALDKMLADVEASANKK